MKECELYKKEKCKRKDKLNVVRCLACAHKCLIFEGKTGICKTRKNINGKLYSLVYGKVASMNIDPIEKKPLYHFLSGTKTYSIGTVGCNFRCLWCQNYDISQFEGGEIFGKDVKPEQIVDLTIKNNCRSVAYTYNEPTIFIEFVRDTAILAKSKGLKNIMVTNGYMSKESFDFVSDYIDAINIDLKSFSDKFYKEFCGASLKPVLETIKRAYDKDIHIELTTLVIPGLNDSDEEFRKIAKFIFSINPEIPWHISRFFPMYRMIDRKITPLETLQRAQHIGQKYLKYVHIGNVGEI